MNTDQVLEAIMNHPGSMMPVVIESPVDTLKSVHGVAIVKRSRLFVTCGTEYRNRKEIREAIEAGLRGEPMPLPWGVWAKYPYVIHHTPKKTGVPTDYIRAFPPSEEQMRHFNLAPSVQFFANGQEITREQAIEFCGSNAKADDTHKSALALAVPNIVSIG